MLAAIRAFWSLAILLVVVSVIHFLMFSTGPGARMALHDTLAKHFGKKWGEWVEYSAFQKDGDSYTAVIEPLSEKDDTDPPASWNPRVKTWWDEIGPPPSDKLKVIIRYGEVWYGNPNTPRAAAFALGYGIPSRTLLITSLIIAIILVIAAIILGKMTDVEMHQKQYHRPGSVIDR